MKHLLIFVLLLVACSDVNFAKCTQFEVTISDALPIQFWLADCDTYNEKEVCGVHRKCFCQPWNCDDEILIQFTDTVIRNYILNIINSDSETELPFTLQQAYPGNGVDIFEDFPTSGWTNDIEPIGGQFWSLVGSDRVSTYQNPFTLNYSRYLTSEIHVSAQTFEVTVNFSNEEICDLEIIFYANGVAVGSDYATNVPAGTNQNIVFNITTTENADTVILRVLNYQVTLDSTTATIHSAVSVATPQDSSPIIYSLQFTPSDESICNGQFRFEIAEADVSPENIVAKSDCIDIQNSHDCTTLIEYTNNRNFAGLIYQDVSPATSFKILVPAIFFHERFPEEDNVIEVSDAIIHTSGQVKAQRLLETDYLPYYMHRKLKLILKHQTVLIDNQYWTKEESYDVQDGERRWPVKKAKCFLTEKNYVQRAVL